MQLSSGTQIPDGLLAAMTLLNEKPRLGVPSKNPAPNQGIDERNSTAAIGMRLGERLNSVGQSRRARYYNPSTGRFLSEDPIGFRGGFNKYAYAFGSPTNFNDPSGNITNGQLAAGAIIAAQFIPGVGEVVDAGLLLEGGGAALEAAEGAFEAAEAAGEAGEAGEAEAAEGAEDPMEEGRKPRGGCCFAAGTLVHTDHGDVPVEQISVGDKVLSSNRATENLEYQPVIALTRPHKDVLVDLTVEGEQEVLKPSLSHPFWVERGTVSLARWMAAGQIQVGDLVETIQGDWKQVTSATTEAEPQTVYNFTVDQNHDYFVGNTGYLVHNSGCPCSWGNPNTLADHFFRHGSDFGSLSPEAYAEQAAQFLQDAIANALPTKIDGSGVIRAYDPGSNTFGSYNPNGTTRTFYKPRRGAPYWNDQPGGPPCYP